MTSTRATTDNADVERIVDLGLGLDLVYMTDGKLRIAHDCKLVGDDQRERILIPLDPRAIFTPAPVTITPSIRCLECGLDGWVIRSQWTPS